MTIVKSSNGCYVAGGKISLEQASELRTRGFKWNSILKGMWATKDPTVAAVLKHNMPKGDRLELEKEVARWKASLVLSSETEAQSISSLELKDDLYLLPHQSAGIKYILTRHGTLLADEMGLGKTIQAAVALDWLMDTGAISTALVVCPSSLKINWKKELTKWLHKSHGIQLVTAKDTVSILHGTRIVIINYDLLSKWKDALTFRGAKRRNWGCIIADESHYLKNPSTIRSRALFSLKSEFKIALSGTPMPNSPKELWSIAHWMRPDIFYNQWYFYNEYCNVRREFGRLVIDGGKNLGRLQKKMRASFMCRRKKEAVLKDLPDKQRQIIELPHGLDPLVKEEKDEYATMNVAREAQRELRKLKANGVLDKAAYKSKMEASLEIYRVAFGRLAIVRKRLALKKLPICVEHVNNMLESIDSLVIFTYHKEPAYKLDSMLAVESAVITGDTPIDARNKAVEGFQSGKVRVIIGTIGAMGTGLTLTKASNVVMMELDWCGTTLEQAEDRCHRIGQKSSVLVQYLVLHKSLDSNMMNKICVKGKLIHETLEKEGE